MESVATQDRQARRPGPLRWIRYALGGSLSPRYRQWVLHDLTCRGRWIRQIVRAVLQVAPFAVLLLLTLGTSWITWVGVICGLGLALVYSLAYFNQSADYRLVKHGFPPGTAALLRDYPVLAQYEQVAGVFDRLQRGPTFSATSPVWHRCPAHGTEARRTPRSAEA